MLDFSRICAPSREISFAVLPFVRRTRGTAPTGLEALKESTKSCALCDLPDRTILAIRKDVDMEYKEVSGGVEGMWARESPPIRQGNLWSRYARKIPAQWESGCYATEDKGVDKPRYIFGGDLSIRPKP